MPHTPSTLSTIILERHSVRKYDPNFTISQEEILDILKEATLAPSSSNLQPWKFLVIQDPEVKKELRAIANNQEPVETSSAVIAVLGDKQMYHNVEQVARGFFDSGYIDEETLNKMVTNNINLYSSAPEASRMNIASFDTGLVSMQIMLIAKARGYDTLPMGGFDKQKFIEHFEISDRYFPSVLIALGKAEAPGRPTTRLPIEDLVSFI